MLGLLIACIGTLLTIFFVIGIHETAHFAMAKMLGIKVLRFSIGFGKTLLRYQDRQGTEYVLALIPLGGYVKMLDEDEESTASVGKSNSFNSQPFYKKALVILAGPISNLVCALFLYWLIFMIGFVTIKPIIGEITPHSIASESGLKPQQEIVGIDNTKVNDWPSVLFALLAHLGEQNLIDIKVIDIAQKKNESYILDVSNWSVDKLIPDLLGSLGIIPFQPKIPLVIGHIAPSTPAATSNLQVKDEIIAINKTPIKTWEQLSQYIMEHPNQTTLVTLKRGTHLIQTPIKIGEQTNLFLQKRGLLGISPDFKWPGHLLKYVHYQPFPALIMAWYKLNDLVYVNWLSLEKLLTGKISFQSLGGPITIFSNAGTALNNGFIAFINFLAFISIAIGFVNLLPIPGLDGGVFIIYLTELIYGKPLSKNIIETFYKIGLVLILYLLIQTLTNDILRLF